MIFAEAMAEPGRPVVIPRILEFEPGRIRVYSESRERLAKIARQWRDNGGWGQITVHAHALERGRFSGAGHDLALRRAHRIRGYLIRYGIDPAYVVCAAHVGEGARARAGTDRHVDLAITRCVRADGDCLPPTTLSAGRAARPR